MWIDPITGETALTHSEVRALRPNWSAPNTLTDEMITDVGFVVVDTTEPTKTEYQDAVPDGVELVDGHYKRKYYLVDWNQTRIDAHVAEVLAKNQSEMAAYLVEVRDLREKLLNRISGIATAALCTTDQATVDAYIAARQRLLDITKVPAALAATTRQELEAAIKAEYVSIVTTTAAVLRTAFYQVEG